MAKVVACMPAWNAARFIVPVLQSLADQTYTNLDVLISVDPGDDETAAICEAFASRRPNFSVIRQPSRLGWVGNSNWLLRHARGEFFFFAAHDDPLHPTYVARLVEALERHPGAVLAFCDMRSDRGIERYCDLEGVVDRFERARRVLLPIGPWWCPHRGVFRAQAAAEVGGLRRHRGGEGGVDWVWLMALAVRGEVVRVAEPLIVKNRRADGLNAQLIRSQTIWKRLFLTLACLREIRRVRPPLATAMRLHVDGLIRFLRGELWNAARHRAKR
jgi:glycosyltransferase involved in cell wall biosynthesis